MNSKNENWSKGRGHLGVLQPLLGEWRASAESPMGKINCFRNFKSILAGKYIELHARWEFAKGVYEEVAIYGLYERKLAFWSFTSDGKKSQGYLADGTDVHPMAICFEAEMPAGLARMIYWPNDEGGMNWAVESKNKKGWSRFTIHHYLPE
jgi:hypothetical protein